MAETLNDIELQSKNWLKRQLKQKQLVFEKSSIETKIYKFLKHKSFLEDLNKQYCFIKDQFDSAEIAFKNNFWIIVFQFLNLSFKDGWYLTGNYAYKFLVEDFSIHSSQISLATKSKSNRIIDLISGVKILAAYDENFDTKPILVSNCFAGSYSHLKHEFLIINSTLSEYKNFKYEIMSLLKSSDRDDQYILEFFKANSSPVLLARLIGALDQIGDTVLRLELEEFFKIMDAKIKVVNPFDDFVLSTNTEKPIYVSRFEISILKAIKILEHLKKPKKLTNNLTDKDIDAIIVDDTYHSLTIEGYTVTKALIDYLQENDSEQVDDVDLKNQLAAKGFMNALGYIKKIISSNFVINEALSKKLFQELWKPSINAKLINGELNVYRNHMVSIKGANFVPPAHEKLYALLDTLFDYLKEIENGFERGIFLHYFYVWIHPHSDGNGRISRFLMNLAFVQGKYRWLTIPSEDRKKYFAALERSQLEDDISYFAEYILEKYKENKI